MKEFKVIEVKESVFASNEKQANLLRDELRKKGCFLLNVMSAPGSGKTTTILKTIELLKDNFKIGVMEADIDSHVDAEKVAQTGVKVIQVHTGGMCHLDASMTKQGLDELGLEELDLVILENVGNLVCPAEFDTGSSKNVMILSVPEGDDKPLKYPLMFTVSEVLLINKIDTLGIFEFDIEKVKERAQKLNPNLKVIPISAKTGEGFEEWINWLKDQVISWKRNKQ